MEISDNNQHMGKGKNWNLFEAKNKTQIQNEQSPLFLYAMNNAVSYCSPKKTNTHIKSKPGL